jgi:hypothetical protein
MEVGAGSPAISGLMYPKNIKKNDRPKGLVIGSLANYSFHEANSAFQ